MQWIRADGAHFNMSRFQAMRPDTPPAALPDILQREFDQGRPTTRKAFSSDIEDGVP